MIMSEESKTYVFGQDSNGMLSMIAPLLQQRGIDPGVLALMRNNSGFGGEGGWFMWIIFLFFLMGWGGNGWGNNRNNGTDFLTSQLNNDYGRDVLLQAINGNGNAISQLATTLNCDINAVQGALNSIQNTVGMSGQQIINSIQSGNSTLASQLAQCCCDNKLLATQQGYESRIATLEQTNQLGAKIDNNTNTIAQQLAAQTTFISDKFCDLEKRELQNRVDALREQVSILNGKESNSAQTESIKSYISSMVTPLIAEVNAIKAAQPPTVNVPYPNLVAVPNAYLNGYGTAVNQGLWG